MRSRDITGSPRSRQNNDPLADLGKVNEYLIHRKRIAIDRLMALLENWLDNNPAFARHAREGSISSSRCAASDKKETSSTGTGPVQSSSRPKRGLPGNGMDGSDPSDDGDEKEERGNKRSRVDSPRALPFACPFFKNDSSKHKHKQACTGPDYEYEEGRSSREWDTAQAYRELLRDAVTQRVRESLEARYHPIEDRVKADFVAIVRNAFADALKQHPDPRRSSYQGSTKTQEVGTSTSGASQATAVAGTGNSLSEDPFPFFDPDDLQPPPATDIGDACLFTYPEPLLPNCELEPDFFSTDNPVDSGTCFWGLNGESRELQGVGVEACSGF
ncbi:hypothetical protein DL768_008217 [Monosporascus sp. mg162]|nr:hypothetical protein DL768_008217 [Monosporascus sp. mg162]